MNWGQFKSSIRETVWPDGEQISLVKAHDKSFLDALIEIQSWVDCSQQDNTSLFPQCSTFYRCGLTLIDSAPRGAIKSVSVIDKISKTTGLEDSTADDDWCSEVFYTQVDPCHFRAYLRGSNSRGCCLPIPLFFGLSGCTKGLFPIPTGVGLPAGLPILPLGFSYPQTSTDRAWGRAEKGIWALERGQLWIAPWIQSTETVVVKWDGIKRDWTDADPIDSDPLLSKTVKLYVQAQHAGEWDHEHEDEAILQQKYLASLAMMIRQCREETRVRECEPSHARAANGVTDLFYNDDQSASVSCPNGTTGSPVSVTILSGSVGSAISKADANSKAFDQATTQAEAQLVCTAVVVTYQNEPQTFTASCVQDDGAPSPDGTPVTVTVQAGEVSSTVSQDAANTAALSLAQSRAEAQLVCVFWNRAASATVTCPSDSGVQSTEAVAAHVYSSTLSQADADALAQTAATNAANDGLSDLGCIIPGAGPFWNTTQKGYATLQCYVPSGFIPPPPSIGSPVVGGGGGGSGGSGTVFTRPCVITVVVTVGQHTFSSVTSQADANSVAVNNATSQAELIAAQKCAQRQCGTFEVSYGGGFAPK